MDRQRLAWVWNVGSYLAASIILAYGIWWMWEHGWPNLFGLFDILKLQIYMFMGAPFALLAAICWLFLGGKKPDA